MLSALISFLVAGLVFAGLFNFFGLIASILPSLFVLLLVFFLISRSIAKNLESSMQQLQKQLRAGHVDKSLVSLFEIKKKYGAWQFFLASTIDGQIGSIHYMKGNFQKAKPFLENAFVKHWIAKAMLALIYYRERKYKKMNEVFEQASKYSKKTGLLWSLWAYCNWRIDNTERAIEILAKGKSYLENSDPTLTNNLLALQNKKRMKMKSYGEQWYQFQLEVSPQQTQMRQGRVRFKAR